MQTTCVCAIGRFVSNDVSGGLSDIFGVLFGIFLLREDSQLHPIFLELHETLSGYCGDGGLGCVLPYAVISLLNGMLSSMRVYAMLARYGTFLPCGSRLQCWLPCWLLASAISQLVAAFISWALHKELQQAQAAYSHAADEVVRCNRAGVGAMQTRNPWASQLINAPS